MKVIVSVFNNLLTDQRVEKVCKTLHDNGYEVLLIGNSWKGTPEMERPYPFTRIILRSKSLKLAYPEFNYLLYREIKKKVDQNTILLSNDLDSLLPNYLISKKLKIPLIFDSHEIYTEMPALQKRFTQKIWKTLEKRIVPKISYMMTASNGYANWFSQNYKINKPIVVQNFPRKSEEVQNTIPNNPSIILYQGAINPSRGLDKIIPTMKKFHNAQLWIAGDGPRKKEYETLTKKLGLEKKIQFIGNIAPEKLKKITQKADVGLSIEENNGISYFYSLPNKISDYIQARVPIVTSNFPEMKKIVDQYKIGETINDHSEKELFDKISIVLKNGKSFYHQNLDKAAAQLCWENEEPKILSLFSQVISDRKQ